MLASPFAFYRGAAAIMAADLAGSPTTGITVQLCGDAHISNFGLYASPERRLVFDINDFDETHPGPWEWDVKRLAASIAVASRGNGFSRKAVERAVLAGVAGYRLKMRELATQGELAVWYASVHADLAAIERLRGTQARREARRVVARAHTRDHTQAQARLTQLVDGRMRLRSDPPLMVPIRELVDIEQLRRHADALMQLLHDYIESLDVSLRPLLRRYRFMDLAHRVVGVGSVGLRAWVALYAGRDDDDPLFLQVKEASTSVLEPYLEASPFENAGQRVVAGQRLMQASSDILLGWLRAIGPDGHEADYYVRQLRDWKGSAEIEVLGPSTLADYAASCGRALARSHARSGDRAAIAGWLGKGDSFERALATFAIAYADQNDRDYQALRDAVAAGRIEAIEGL
jgi:uncharacterized protein (DUF2252 family)